MIFSPSQQFFNHLLNKMLNGCLPILHNCNSFYLDAQKSQVLQWITNSSITIIHKCKKFQSQLRYSFSIANKEIKISNSVIRLSLIKSWMTGTYISIIIGYLFLKLRLKFLYFFIFFHIFIICENVKCGNC